jgi:hypothetical protein
MIHDCHVWWGECDGTNHRHHCHLECPHDGRHTCECGASITPGDRWNEVLNEWFSQGAGWR